MVQISGFPPAMCAWWGKWQEVDLIVENLELRSSSKKQTYTKWGPDKIPTVDAENGGSWNPAESENKWVTE